MFLNQYSVRIISNSVIPEESQGYVKLPHNTKYKLRIRNNHKLRCHAQVFIDGKDQGTWLLNSKQTVDLERPAYQAKKFTFYKRDSEEGQQAELSSIDSSELGLVKVIFTPEKEPKPPVYSPPSDWYYWNILNSKFYADSVQSNRLKSGNYSVSTASISVGGTGLEGASYQWFQTVAGLDLDETKSTTIYLRLVVDEDVNKITPLKHISSKIPPPIY